MVTPAAVPTHAHLACVGAPALSAHVSIATAMAHGRADSHEVRSSWAVGVPDDVESAPKPRHP